MTPEEKHALIGLFGTTFAEQKKVDENIVSHTKDLRPTHHQLVGQLEQVVRAPTNVTQLNPSPIELLPIPEPPVIQPPPSPFTIVNPEPVDVTAPPVVTSTVTDETQKLQVDILKKLSKSISNQNKILQKIYDHLTKRVSSGFSETSSED